MSNRKNLPGLALMAVLCIAMVALGIWGFASGNSVQLSAAELAVPTATEAPAEEEAAADEAAAAEDGAAASPICANRPLPSAWRKKTASSLSPISSASRCW